MELNVRSKRELTFLGIGILMLIIVIVMTVESFGFLLGSIDAALNKTPAGAQSAIQFKTDAASAVIKQ